MVEHWRDCFSREAALPAFRLSRQPGGLARPVGVGKGLDADDPPITDGQERGSGLIDFELVRPADDVYDDGYLITGVVEPQRLNPVPLPSRQEPTPEAPHAVKASVTVDGKQ
jgi:hypothetical protein